MASSTASSLTVDMIPAGPPPKGVTPDFIHGSSLATDVIAVSAVSSALALVLLLLRLYSTLRITRSAWYDDAACVCATVFSLAHVSLVISIRDHAKHRWDLPITSYNSSYLKTALAEIPIAAFALFCSKISILLLLHRLFNPVKRFRYCVYIGMLWATIISALTIIIPTAYCAPRSGEPFSSLQVVQRCSRTSIWAVVQGSMNVLLDFFILYIPIQMVWKLQMGRKKKVGVTTILMTGFIACVSSVLALVFKTKLLVGSDLEWNIFRVYILSIVEINTSIMVACMPACAAFLRFFTTKTDFFPALKARVFAALGSASTLMKRPSASLNTNNTGSQELPTSHVPATTGARYWRIKNVFSSAKNDPSPQITAKDQSDTLRMGRLNIIRTRGEDWRTLGIVNEEEDATRSSHETEQPRPARTHGWV